MFQKLIIVGHLASDPEMRYTPAGRAYTRFSVGVNRTWKDAAGNKQTEVTWYRVTTWGQQAEVCVQYLAKGRKVLVEADNLRVSPYLNRDNQAAASLEVTARSVRFLDSHAGTAEESADEAEDEAVPA